MPIALYIRSEIGLFRLDTEVCVMEDEGPDCERDRAGAGGGELVMPSETVGQVAGKNERA